MNFEEKISLTNYTLKIGDKGPPRITDDMLVLAFLNPFVAKLAILDKHIEGKFPQSGVTRRHYLKIKLVLEERRKKCLTS